MLDVLCEHEDCRSKNVEHLQDGEWECYDCGRTFNARNWGSDIIPKEKWIDPNKTYQTRNGHRVENIKIVMNNSTGRESTYPVKGTIIMRENPRKVSYYVWVLDGRSWVGGGEDKRDFDLIEIAEDSTGPMVD